MLSLIQVEKKSLIEIEIGSIQIGKSKLFKGSRRKHSKDVDTDSLKEAEMKSLKKAAME